MQKKKKEINKPVSRKGNLRLETNERCTLKGCLGNETFVIFRLNFKGAHFKKKEARKTCCYSDNERSALPIVLVRKKEKEKEFHPEQEKHLL